MKSAARPNAEGSSDIIRGRRLNSRRRSCCAAAFKAFFYERDQNWGVYYFSAIFLVDLYHQGNLIDLICLIFPNWLSDYIFWLIWAAKSQHQIWAYLLAGVQRSFLHVLVGLFHERLHWFIVQLYLCVLVHYLHSTLCFDLTHSHWSCSLIRPFASSIYRVMEPLISILSLSNNHRDKNYLASLVFIWTKFI